MWKEINSALYQVAVKAKAVADSFNYGKSALVYEVNSSSVIELKNALGSLDKTCDETLKRIEKQNKRFITMDDLMETFGAMQLIVDQPRYSSGKYCAVFGSREGYFAEMVDSLTDGGDDWLGAYGLFTNTPWYPYGEGNTVYEAIENALDRINTIDPKYKREAMALVANSSSMWNRELRESMPSLVLTGEEY